MNKQATLQAINYFKKTVYLSRAVKAFRFIENAVLIIMAMLTLAQVLTVFRKH